MTVSVRVNETVVEVKPAIPAVDRVVITVDTSTAAGILNATLDGLGANRDLYTKVNDSMTETYTRAVPAVTKVEKTYDIVGLTWNEIVYLNTFMRWHSNRTGPVSSAVKRFVEGQF